MGIMAADLPAVAFLKAALAIGRRIPEDLKIVSYDGTFVTKTCTVELTQIRQHYLEIAKKAANMLFEMINEKMTGSEEEKKYQDVILPGRTDKGRHYRAAVERVMKKSHSFKFSTWRNMFHVICLKHDETCFNRNRERRKRK